MPAPPQPAARDAVGRGTGVAERSCGLCRGFCQLEVNEARRLKKRVVLVTETDTRHGAAQPLQAPLMVVRCARCAAPATLGTPGALWPSWCEEHAAAGESVALSLSPEVPSDALNYSLVHEELVKDRYVVTAAALELATAVLGDGGGAQICARVRWFSELARFSCFFGAVACMHGHSSTFQCAPLGSLSRQRASSAHLVSAPRQLFASDGAQQGVGQWRGLQTVALQQSGGGHRRAERCAS